MSIEGKAKINTLEKLTKIVEEQGVSGMGLIAMSMNSMMAIDVYQEQMDEIVGDFSGLIKALEEGGYKDENGTELVSSLTFQNLKKRLIKEER